jgi:hypothetical protein
MGGQDRSIDRTRLRAERIYPVRLRLRIPPLGLQSIATDMYPWLRSKCGHRKFWAAPGPRISMDDSVFVYLSSVGTAKDFVEHFDCAHLIECSPHPSPEVGDPVYDPDS